MARQMLKYPLPRGNISYENFLVDGEPSAIRRNKRQEDANVNKMFGVNNNISRKFLVEMSNLRAAIRDNLGDNFFKGEYDKVTFDVKISVLRKYFERLMALMKILSNDRHKYHTFDIIPVFNWTTCNGNTYSSTCWRYEMIMTGYLYAMWLFNRSVSVSTDLIKSQNLLYESYDVLRRVCLEEIRNWTTRDEYKQDFPFECLESGIKLILSIVMIQIQHQMIRAMCYNTTDKKTFGLDLQELANLNGTSVSNKQTASITKNYNNITKIEMCLWLHHECQCAKSLMLARMNEGMCMFLLEWNDVLLDLYRKEAFMLALYQSVAYCRNANDHTRAQKIAEHTLDFIKTDMNFESKRKAKQKKEEQILIPLIQEITKMLVHMKSASASHVASIVYHGSTDKSKLIGTIWSILPIVTVRFLANLPNFAKPIAGLDASKYAYIASMILNSDIVLLENGEEEKESVNLSDEKILEEKVDEISEDKTDEIIKQISEEIKDEIAQIINETIIANSTESMNAESEEKEPYVEQTPEECVNEEHDTEVVAELEVQTVEDNPTSENVQVKDVISEAVVVEQDQTEQTNEHVSLEEDPVDIESESESEEEEIEEVAKETKSKRVALSS